MKEEKIRKKNLRKKSKKIKKLKYESGPSLPGLM